jgi:hypothetical protein
MEPLEPTGSEEPARPTARRLACVLPFLLGVAIVLILLILFYYLLVTA